MLSIVHSEKVDKHQVAFKIHVLGNNMRKRAESEEREREAALESDMTYVYLHYPDETSQRPRTARNKRPKSARPKSRR